MKKFLYVLLVLAMLPVALLVIITPMDSQKQYIFGLLSIGVLFLMGFSKKTQRVGHYGGHVGALIDALYVFPPDANPAF